jgi:hypothetical protein
MSLGSVRLTPFEPLDAHRQLGNLATQLVRLPGPAAELAQLEPDLRYLTRDEITQQGNLVLERLVEFETSGPCARMPRASRRPWVTNYTALPAGSIAEWAGVIVR